MKFSRCAHVPLLIGTTMAWLIFVVSSEQSKSEGVVQLTGKTVYM